jgi:hypothetical protein
MTQTPGVPPLALKARRIASATIVGVDREVGDRAIQRFANLPQLIQTHYRIMAM